jgi:hypothetical protein
MAKTSLVQLNDDLIGSILVISELTAIDHHHQEIMISKKNQQIVIAFQVAKNRVINDLDSL